MKLSPNLISLSPSSRRALADIADCIHEEALLEAIELSAIDQLAANDMAEQANRWQDFSRACQFELT